MFTSKAAFTLLHAIRQHHQIYHRRNHHHYLHHHHHHHHQQQQQQQQQRLCSPLSCRRTSSIALKTRSRAYRRQTLPDTTFCMHDSEPMHQIFDQIVNPPGQTSTRSPLATLASDEATPRRLHLEVGGERVQEWRKRRTSSGSIGSLAEPVHQQHLAERAGVAHARKDCVD